MRIVALVLVLALSSGCASGGFYWSGPSRARDQDDLEAYVGDDAEAYAQARRARAWGSVGLSTLAVGTVCGTPILIAHELDSEYSDAALVTALSCVGVGLIGAAFLDVDHHYRRKALETYDGHHPPLPLPGPRALPPPSAITPPRSL